MSCPTGPTRPPCNFPVCCCDLEQEAATERGGPLPTPPGGPVWREREEDWNDSDAALADLAKAGLHRHRLGGVILPRPVRLRLPQRRRRGLLGRPQRHPRHRRCPRHHPPGTRCRSPSCPRLLSICRKQRAARMPRRRARAPSRSPKRCPPRPVRRRRHVARRARGRVQRAGAVTKKGNEATSRNPVVATVTGVVLAAVLLLCFRPGRPWSSPSWSWP